MTLVISSDLRWSVGGLETAGLPIYVCRWAPLGTWYIVDDELLEKIKAFDAKVQP